MEIKINYALILPVLLTLVGSLDINDLRTIQRVAWEARAK